MQNSRTSLVWRASASKIDPCIHRSSPPFLEQITSDPLEIQASKFRDSEPSDAAPSQLEADDEADPLIMPTTACKTDSLL